MHGPPSCSEGHKGWPRGYEEVESHLSPNYRDGPEGCPRGCGEVENIFRDVEKLKAVFHQILENDLEVSKENVEK